MRSGVPSYMRRLVAFLSTPIALCAFLNPALAAMVGNTGAGGITPSAGPTSISGSIGTGGTAQLLVAASTGAGRRLIIQNLSTDPLCFSKFTVTPVCGTNGSYILQAATSTTAGNGGSYTTPIGTNDSLAFYIIGATTGDKFTAETSQ